MKKLFRILFLIAFSCFLSPHLHAQSSQTVSNGQTTTPVNFAGSCTYNWTNTNPSIGLAASGTGNIASFKAINTGSTAVTATITAMTPPVGFAYIPNAASASLSIIDLSTNKVISVIPLGGFPQGVCVSPDGSKVYITDQDNGNIFILSTATNKIIGKISADVGIYGIVCSPDGSTLYVGNLGNNIIKIYNTSTYSLMQSVSIINSAVGMAISNDGKNVYVTNSSSGVSIINTATNSVTNIPDGGGNPYDVVVSPDNNTLYVANKSSGNVSVINTTTNLVTKIIPVGHNPFGIVVSPDGGHVYVSNYSDNTVSVIDAAKLQVTSVIPVGDEPYGMSITSDGSLLYVANVLSSNVSVINTQTNKVTAATLVGTYPEAVGNFILNTPTNCPPVNFTITVNPSSLTPSITTTAPTGNISACVGTASANPNIQQFTISGTNLTGAIIASPTAGFEVSLTAASGFSNTVQVNPVNGSINNAIIYVRSAASGGSGLITGLVKLTSSGAGDKSVVVEGVVNALPTVSQPGNQTVPNGTATTAVDFNGNGNTFNWINDTPGIGLAANGTGNIAAFIAVNTGSSKVTATVTVTPSNASMAYIGNSGDNTISVINTATQKVVNTIPFNTTPYSIAVSPDGQEVYIGSYAGTNVTVLNTSTNLSVIIPSITAPSAICVSPDNTRFYVASDSPGTIYVFNVGSNTLAATINVGNIPIGMVISPDGSKLYAAVIGNNSIDVINTSSNKIINTIPAPANSGPVWPAISPDGNTLYVTNNASNTLSVINTVRGNIIANIPTGNVPYAIAMSPDGSRVFVVNQVSNSVTVINTATYKVVATIGVGDSPAGISISNDGTELYVVNNHSGTVSVISTANNMVTATIPVGKNPTSYGSFILPEICPGSPVSFTITVDPAAGGTIAYTTPTGTISACAGTPSADPNVQQFNASGTGLTNDITVTAPTGFEVSRDIDGPYSGTLTLTQTNGNVGSSLIFVRSGTTAPVGNITDENITLSSGGVQKLVPISGTIYAIPMANKPPDQTLITGTQTAPVIFTGTATSYTWVNNTTGIGLSANGTGDIPAFTAVNHTNTPVSALITVTPVNSTDCDGSPVEFHIIVEPTPTVLSINGDLTPLTTVYGTASSAEKFGVSCTTIDPDVLVTPPPGFELSSDGTNFSPTLNLNITTINSAVTVYIRLASSTLVGNYDDPVTISTANASDQQIEMPISTVTPAPLTITADNKTRPYDFPNPALTVTYYGFVNNDGPSALTTLPLLSTAATISSAAGQYPITISGASSPEYNINNIQGILTITPSLSLQDIPNTFTPNGDGRNDTWVINGLQYYPIATVNIFNRWGQKLYYSVGYPVPWDGTYHGKALPTGAYYYIIDLKNGQPLLAGFVEIIR